MHYFQQHSSVFLRNIYQSPKGAIRLAIVQRDLQPLLQTSPLRILDLGGGAGQMALWYAALGHQVTLVDAAENLLQEALRQAEALQLSSRLNVIHGDFFAVTPAEKFDLVSCHAVLEWTENGDDLLRLCRERMKKSAFLSFLYYNRDALEFAQHVFGNFYYLERGLQPKRKNAKLTPKHPRSLAQVEALLARHHLHRLHRSAIRCFYDYMKPADRERCSLEDLIAREMALSDDPRFIHVARYVHELIQMDI